MAKAIIHSPMARQHTQLIQAIPDPHLDKCKKLISSNLSREYKYIILYSYIHPVRKQQEEFDSISGFEGKLLPTLMDSITPVHHIYGVLMFDVSDKWRFRFENNASLKSLIHLKLGKRVLAQSGTAWRICFTRIQCTKHQHYGYSLR